MLTGGTPGMNKFAASSWIVVSWRSPSPQTVTRSSLQSASSLVATMRLVARILLEILSSLRVMAARSQCTVGAVTRSSSWVVIHENNLLVVLAGIPTSSSRKKSTSFPLMGRNFGTLILIPLAPVVK